MTKAKRAASNFVTPEMRLSVQTLIESAQLADSVGRGIVTFREVLFVINAVELVLKAPPIKTKKEIEWIIDRISDAGICIVEQLPSPKPKRKKKSA
jgi:hypothetical protein